MKNLFTKNYWAMKGFALLVLVVMGGSVRGQSTNTWSTSTTGSTWVRTSNWSTTSFVPGNGPNTNVSVWGSTSDVGQIGSCAFTSNILAINFSASTNNGTTLNSGTGTPFNLGAIVFQNTANKTITINNSSTTQNGIIKLNGGYNLSNIIIDNQSTSYMLTLANGTTSTMEIVLNNLTNNIVKSLSGGITISSVISGSNPIEKQGSGVLTLSGINTYSGNTTISAGTLALSTSGSIANSPNIIIGSGSTFSVSGLTTALSLASSQTLKSSSTGSNTTGTITVASSKNLTLSSGGLEFTAYGGGATSPLTVTGASAGALELNSAPITVTTTSALAIGTYKLIAKSGSSTGVSGTIGALTIGGSGLATNTTGALSLSSGELLLTVTTIPTNNWIGATSTSWNNTGNWSLGTVPLSTDNITISSGNPVIDIDYTLASGRTLTISGTGTLTINPTKTLTIAGTADFGGKSVTLKSDVNGSAAIGQITGTLSNVTNLTVERYIPALRKFRFLAAPVVGATAAQWRDNGGTTPGIGTHITGNINGGINFDASTTNAASAFWYNEALAGSDATVGSGATSDPGWTAFTDGNTQALTNGKGFRILVRGDRTISLDGTGSVTPTNTTLSVTGTYPANSVTIATTRSASNTNSGFNLVGNPYPATIDWNAVTKGTDISTTYTIYDPTSGTYKSTNDITGAASQYIASGQAFFVQQLTGTTSSITIDESDKVSNAAGNYFRNKLSNHLKVSMTYDSANYDAAFIHFREDALNDFDTYDGLKFQNAGVNIASVGTDGKRYNINSLASLTKTTEMPLSVLGSVLTNFELKFEDVESFKNHELYLIDHYLNKMLLLSDGFTYPIELSSDSASVKDGRFKIVFVQKATGINFNEKNSNAFILYPNPAANTIHLLLDAKNTNNENVSFEIFNQLGARLQQGSLDFITAKDQTIAIDNLAQGSYFIKLQGQQHNQTIKFIK